MLIIVLRHEHSKKAVTSQEYSIGRYIANSGEFLFVDSVILHYFVMSDRRNLLLLHMFDSILLPEFEEGTITNYCPDDTCSPDISSRGSDTTQIWCNWGSNEQILEALLNCITIYSPDSNFKIDPVDGDCSIITCDENMRYGGGGVTIEIAWMCPHDFETLPMVNHPITPLNNTIRLIVAELLSSLISSCTAPQSSPLVRYILLPCTMEMVCMPYFCPCFLNLVASANYSNLSPLRLAYLQIIAAISHSTIHGAVFTTTCDDNQPNSTTNFTLLSSTLAPLRVLYALVDSLVENEKDAVFQKGRLSPLSPRNVLK